MLKASRSIKRCAERSSRCSDWNNSRINQHGYIFFFFLQMSQQAMKLETNLSENREQLGNKLFLREIGHGKKQKKTKKVLMFFKREQTFYVSNQNVQFINFHCSFSFSLPSFHC